MSKNIPLPKEKIDELVDGARTVQDAVKALYVYLYPGISGLDKDKQLSGFPRVSPETDAYVLDKLVELHRKRGPKLAKARARKEVDWLWLMAGFTMLEDVPSWEADVSHMEVTDRVEG